jgi:hypothetical protein
MARATDTLVGINVIDEAANKIAYKDGNGDPMENALLICVISDKSAQQLDSTLWAMLRTAVAPVSSGTRYASLVPGSLAIDMVAGKAYIKTSAVGATDAWAVIGAQT